MKCLTIRSSSEWKADHRQPPRWRQHVERAGQRRLQHVQFAIDRDPQRLKGAGRRVNLAAPPGRDRPGDDRRQLLCRRERRARPFAHDGAGNSPRPAVLAIGEDEVGQLVFRQGIDEIGRCRGRAGTKAHVERAGSVEGEATSRVGELVGRETEVKQHAVERREAGFARIPREVSEIPLAQDQPVAGCCHERRAARERRRVGVESEHAASGRAGRQQRPCMPTTAEGAIEVTSAGSGHQSGDCFRQQHRRVARRRVGWVSARESRSVIK